MLFPYRLQLCYRMWSISNVEAVKSLPPFLDVRWLTSAKPHRSLVLLCASLLGKLISTRCWWDIHKAQAHEPHRAPPPSSSPTITIKIPSQSLFLSLSSHFSDQLGKCVFFPKHLILWLRNFFIHFRCVCVCAHECMFCHQSWHLNRVLHGWGVHPDSQSIHDRAQCYDF